MLSSVESFVIRGQLRCIVYFQCRGHRCVYSVECPLL